MSHVFRRTLALVFAAGFMVAGIGVGSASADPIRAKNSSTITIDCGAAGVFETVINGNGNFTPAHDLNSTSVLIPVAFGEFTGVFTDTEGNQQAVSEPPSAKGSAAPAGKTLLSCTYFLEFTSPGGTFSGSGGVTGFIPH